MKKIEWITSLIKVKEFDIEKEAVENGIETIKYWCEENNFIFELTKGKNEKYYRVRIRNSETDKLYSYILKICNKPYISKKVIANPFKPDVMIEVDDYENVIFKKYAVLVENV